MTDFSESILFLDDFRIDVKNRQISFDGKLLTLTAKYFDVLIYLIQNNNRLITKDELYLRIWGDSYVTDTALSQCIKDIRKTLNDDPKNPRFLKTITKHGFIFLKEPELISKEQLTQPITKKSILKRPYKFLDYFTEQDTDIFFGREEEIHTICSKILNHRSFLIYGRSGVGKSSITHAGLIPELKKHGHFAFVIRSFSDPIKEINEYLNNLNKNDLVNSDKKIICFFDQFEDFFLIENADIRKIFIDKIHSLEKSENLRFKAVFVIREDLLAEMDIFKSILPEIFFHEHRLQKLKIEQSRKAIFGPAKLMNIKIEMELVEKILKDLSENGFIDPPQLQIVCDTLFDKRNSSSIISLETYENLGGAKQVLTGYLDSVLNHFQKSDLEIVKNILLNLINDKLENQILAINDLRQIIFNQCTNEKFQNLIEEVSAHRIIRIFRIEGETLIELTHDFLAHEISKWRTAESVALQKAREVFERAFENYTSHNIFPEEESLAIISPVAQKIIVNKEKYNFWLSALLNAGHQIPQWLTKNSSDAKQQIQNAIKNKRPEIRISAIESFKHLQDHELNERIKYLALSDSDLHVRKTAAIVLSDLYGVQSVAMLSDYVNQHNFSLIQKAISLAFIRDYDKKHVDLKKTNPVISLMILIGLIWVRFRRHQSEIFNSATRAAAGAAISGLMIGILLGLFLVTYRNQPLFESTTILLSLASLGILSGFLVGFGIAFGMTSFRLIGQRHSTWWSAVGALMGGWIVGGIINILGVDFFVALSGQNISGLAGAFEAAGIGFGISVGYLLSEKSQSQKKWLKVFYPAFGSTIVAIILTLIEGSLFSASIDKIAESFIESKIDFKPIANIFGEKYFGEISRLSLAAFEGFVFGASFYIADKFRFLFKK